MQSVAERPLKILKMLPPFERTQRSPFTPSSETVSGTKTLIPSPMGGANATLQQRRLPRPTGTAAAPPAEANWYRSSATCWPSQTGSRSGDFTTTCCLFGFTVPLGMATSAAAASPSLASGASLSFTDACSLIQNPHSCLVLDTCRRHLALCPLYMNRKRSGIERQLKTELFRFAERSHQCCSFVPEDVSDDPAKTGETHTGLQGVPVAYNKIRLIGELGDIFDDQGYIHINIEADFVIFRPNIGQKLVGAVNKVAPSHIGCLVHGCFNASIPKPHQANGVWPGFEVTVGDTLEFEVVQLDADAAGVLCIRGQLDKSVQAPYGADFEELREEGFVEQDGGKGGKKKKKKKKWKDEECEETAKQTVSCTESDKSLTKNEMENVEEILDSKSKKRKQRTEEPNTDTEIHEGDASDCHEYSKPIKKKRKFSVSELDTTNCAQELKCKKRRKHD